MRILLLSLLLLVSTTASAINWMVYQSGKMVMLHGDPKICLIDEEKNISKCWTPILETSKINEDRVEYGSLMEETDLKRFPLRY